MAATPTTRPANVRRPEPAFQRRGRLARQLIVVPVTALFLVPLWLMIVASLRPLGEAPPQSVQWFPTSPAWGNYAEVFEVVPFARYTANSLLVAAIAVPLSVVVASWAGFAIARLPRRSRVFLIGLCVGVLMIPATSLLVGRVSVFRWLGLTDTPIPLMAPALLGMSPLFVLLYAWTTSRLSGDLFDLALERGLSPVATWWRVAMPLQRGTTAAVASLSFVISWGNFLDPLIYLYDGRWFTVPLGMRSLAIVPVTEQPLMLAASVLACLPVLASFLFVQRRLFTDPRTETVT
ncbi:MAG TPA: carbohydrate ABC transporter permease [Actinomycetota bacterium]|nr:carbohydrate ABC transporter permease [Actinomycetota bacterium]